MSEPSSVALFAPNPFPAGTSCSTIASLQMNVACIRRRLTGSAQSAVEQGAKLGGRQCHVGQGELVGQHGSRFEYVHFASAKSGTAYMPTVSNQWTDIDRRRGNQGSNGTGSVRAV